MKKFYFTLSKNQGGPGCVVVTAIDSGAARKRMLASKYGNKWAFSYNELEEVHLFDRKIIDTIEDKLINGKDIADICGSFDRNFACRRARVDASFPRPVRCGHLGENLFAESDVLKWKQESGFKINHNHGRGSVAAAKAKANGIVENAMDGKSIKSILDKALK